MSLLRDFYNNKRFPIVISGLAIWIFSFGIVMYMQVVYGQNTSSSMVDKLIEDTKKEAVIQKAYRAELIDRLMNSTCYAEYDNFPNKTFIIDQMDTWKLEYSLKQCVASGLIK